MFSFYNCLEKMNGRQRRRVLERCCKPKRERDVKTERKRVVTDCHSGHLCK